jgi:stage IV sporulation protein FB
VRLCTKKTELHISIFVVIIPVLMLIAGYLKEYFITFFSIVLHEISHITVAGRFGVHPLRICITPVGLSASIQNKGFSRQVLLLIHSAGPAANILLFGAALLASAILPQMKKELELVYRINLLLALFNLLPVFPFDGGKILQQLLSGTMGLLAAGRVIKILAWIITALILSAGVIQFRMTGYNLSLLMIGIYIPIVLKDSEMESAFMNIRQILYRRSKLIKKGVYPARDLVVLKSTRVDEILKNMDFDRFHIIYVLDDELRLVKAFTENEIISVFSDENDYLTFGQLLERNGDASSG